MSTKTKVQIAQSDKSLNSFDPKSNHFNFELWAKEVHQQMLTALEQSLRSRRKSSQL